MLQDVQNHANVDLYECCVSVCLRVIGIFVKKKKQHNTQKLRYLNGATTYGKWWHMKIETVYGFSILTIDFLIIYIRNGTPYAHTHAKYHILHVAFAQHSTFQFNSVQFYIPPFAKPCCSSSNRFYPNILKKETC